MVTTGWKFIKGFENYIISPEGEIFSLITNRPIRNCDNGNGYRYVVLRRDGKSWNRYVHRLVCETFFGSSSLEVNHKDGNKTNNCLDNLEYVSSSENTRHGFKKGLMKTCPIVIEKQGCGYWFPTQKECSDFLGASKSAVNALSLGRLKSLFGYSKINEE